MLVKLIRYVRGYVTCIARGKFTERLINILNRQGYTYWNIVPNAVILLIGVLAVVIIIVLAPVESINKPLDEEERRYYARVTHCITALQVCVLIILFCLDLQDYFYAGYVSIVLIAVFMVMGKIAVKRYVQ